MDIESCELCKGFSEKYSSSAKIFTDSKPVIEYQSQKWKPEKVKVLFIAESPPYFRKGRNIGNDGFFYNDSEKQVMYGAPAPLLGTLSWNLFWLLDIANNQSKKQKLYQFKKLACYYTDAVKCRSERFNSKIILNRTVKFCAQHLASEIADVKPNNIVVMGERALYGLKCFQPFKDEITSNSINELLEKTRKAPLVLGNYQLFFIPLPIWRNKLLLEPILEVFTQIKKMIM